MKSTLGYWATICGLVLFSIPNANAEGLESSRDGDVDQFNKTFVTCPNGVEALSQVKAIGNVLTDAQVDLVNRADVLERGSALIVSNPGALNPAIKAPVRMTGCFWFRRTLTPQRGIGMENGAQTCEFEVRPIVNFADFKGCDVKGAPRCTPPPCAAPPVNCNYRNIPRDAFGCLTGCGELVCGPRGSR